MRHEGISLMHLNVTRSQGRARVDLCQVVISSSWCTWSPERGAHFLFVGMLRLQENLKLDNYNTETEANLRVVRLREHEGIHNDSVLSRCI